MIKTYICTNCHSKDVLISISARWDEEHQKFVRFIYHELEHYCEKCKNLGQVKCVHYSDGFFEFKHLLDSTEKLTDQDKSSILEAAHILNQYGQIVWKLLISPDKAFIGSCDNALRILSYTQLEKLDKLNVKWSEDLEGYIYHRR